MGKITSGPPRNVGPKLPYDCIVVDAFASGHFMALLQAPHGIADAISIGPMADQSRAMSAVLKNPAMSQYFVVSLPEELPVVESLELSDKIFDEIGIRPKVLLNRFLPITDELLSAPTEDEKAPELADFKKYLAQVNVRQNEMKQKLESGLGHKIQTLPFILENDPLKIVDSLSRELENV
jgi:anion-transporting  ArsA/GET3 family ATPase